ncbi:MAG: hypothetical protein ACT4P1_13000 [Sporichthyaceae bacterium]
MSEAESMRRLLPRLGAFVGSVVLIVSTFLPWLSVAFLGDLTLLNIAAVTADDANDGGSPVGIAALLITLALGASGIRLAVQRKPVSRGSVACHGAACIVWVVLLWLGARAVVDSANGFVSLAGGAFVALVGAGVIFTAGLVSVDGEPPSEETEAATEPILVQQARATPAGDFVSSRPRNRALVPGAISIAVLAGLIAIAHENHDIPVASKLACKAFGGVWLREGFYSQDPGAGGTYTPNDCLPRGERIGAVRLADSEGEGALAPVVPSAAPVPDPGAADPGWAADVMNTAHLGQGPEFPDSLDGWAMDRRWKDTVRVFEGEWAIAPGPGLESFPVTMNGCGEQRFLIHWRTIGFPVATALRYPYGPLDSTVPDQPPASVGWVDAGGCETVIFRFYGDPQSGSTLTDVAVSVEEWSPAA